MIVDHIKNIGKYPQLKKYEEAITVFIEKCRRKSLPAGRYKLCSDNELSAIVQYYKTKAEAEARMESHVDCSDLQYILRGRETIYYEMAEDLTVAEDRTEKEDIIFYKEQINKGSNCLTEGMFAYYAPQDAHMPCVQCGEGPESVTKIVFKILER